MAKVNPDIKNLLIKSLASVNSIIDQNKGIDKAHQEFIERS